jgi:transcription termination factor NusB
VKLYEYSRNSDYPTNGYIHEYVTVTNAFSTAVTTFKAEPTLKLH